MKTGFLNFVSPTDQEICCATHDWLVRMRESHETVTMPDFNAVFEN
jgi:hypothetical protein